MHPLPREEGDALTMQYILQSPFFFYYPEFGDPSADAQEGYVMLTPYELAARMAAFLWDSIPDEALLQAAERALQPGATPHPGCCPIEMQPFVQPVHRG